MMDDYIDYKPSIVEMLQGHAATADDQFRQTAYRDAIKAIKKLDVRALYYMLEAEKDGDDGQLELIKGIGKSIAEKIRQVAAVERCPF